VKHTQNFVGIDYRLHLFIDYFSYVYHFTFHGDKNQGDSLLLGT